MNERPAILFAVLGLAVTISVGAQPSPASGGADAGRPGAYPPSPVIAGLSLDWSTHRRHALGSDNWQLTWVDDDHQYGAWGDGGGFGGSNDEGRVGLGFARIEGDWQNYRGFNVWGGKSAEHPAQFAGKSYGTVCVEGVLYAWIVPDQPDPDAPRDHYRCVELARSTDHGAHWTKADWRWEREDDLVTPTFLVCGKNNAGARDGFVYSYFIRPQHTNLTQAAFGLNVHQPGAVYLARVPKERIFSGRESYQWFAGWNESKPAWGPLSAKKPVFENPAGTGWCLSVSLIPGLGRYVLATEHTKSHASVLGLWDAPEPWGPWTTIQLWTPDDRFGQNRPGSTLDWKENVFFCAFAPKWFTADGLNLTLVFTGGGNGQDNDSFNTVRGFFRLRDRPPPEPERAAGPPTEPGTALGLSHRWPVILDNDAFSDDWTLEYVLAQASRNRLDLRGIVGCKAGRDGHTIYLTAAQTCAEAEHLIGLARASGIPVRARVVSGADRGMVRPQHDRIEDTEPVRSAGSHLIVAEARQATPERPLVVMVGGHLTDVASAYLQDPSIADRLRVFYIGGQARCVRDYNTWSDSWAFWIAANRLPMVCLPIESLFSAARPQMPFDRFRELPDTPLSRHLRDEKRAYLAKLYPQGENDMAMAVYLMRPDLVRATRRVRLIGWEKDEKGDEAPLVEDAVTGNLHFITDADGRGGGQEWLDAMTRGE